MEATKERLKGEGRARLGERGLEATKERLKWEGGQD